MAFMLLKQVNPSSPALPHLSVVHSKLGVAKGQPVVTSASFAVP